MTHGLQYLLSEPTALMLLVFGVFFGIIFGSIPGLTATLGIVLLIPFTFVMAPEQGLTLLIGVYVGGISGGLIPAILLNIPGTPSSIVTCWDGYPMAKKGLPGTALSLAVFASLVGGFFSAIVLIFVAPQLARIALRFGSWEYFALMMLGMSVVVMLTSKDPIKGMLAAFIGLLLGSVGMDAITGVSRLTFGAWQLQAGVTMMAILMGFFAIREMLVQIKEMTSLKNMLSVKDKIPLFPSRETLKNTGPAFILGCLFGPFIGMLPGVGQGTAAILAYNQARQLSKRPDEFGKGAPEGIVASETANNAVNGGALIPLLTLGIPGDLATAVLIGGLMIHGVQPGPLLFRTNIGIIGAVMIAYFLANIIMYIMELGLMRIFVQVVKVPLAILFPVIMMTCILGVFATNNRIFDLWILVAFGIIGYFFTECDIPMPPILLGYILGQMIESNFRTAMYASGGDLMTITTRPVACVLLTLAIIFAAWPYVKYLVNTYMKGKVTA